MSRSVDGAIAEVYEGAGSGHFLDLLPDLVSRNAGARSCVVQKTDNRFSPTAITHNWFTPEMVATYVEEQIFLDDVWGKDAAEQGIFDRAINIGELTGHERYMRSRFHQDFIRRFGDDSGHCLGALLRQPDGGFLSYGAHRALRAETFGGDDARLLNLLNPHFLRAAAIDDMLAEGRREAEHRRAVLDRLERPVMTVNPALKVVLANAAAEAIAARGDGLLLRAGRLSAPDPASRQRLGEAIRGALTHSGSQGGNLLIKRDRDKMPYRLTIAPLAVNGVTHALILIDDPDGDPLDATPPLRELYGLTRAEAEVAILVAQGHSAEEIAGQRDVGVATVKTLLQRCFRKTDTNRATQLSRIINRLPR